MRLGYIPSKMQKRNWAMSASSGNWRSYISIARPDHWVKHVFIIPGIIAAVVLAPSLASLSDLTANVAVGFISACLIASANYVINEWLDAEWDKFHPEKSNRPGPNGLLRAEYVYIEYFALAVFGLLLAYLVNGLFFLASLALLISGITYNVKPFRTKDRAYVDVLSEAINNPIRLVMGWAMISSQSVPPLSLIGLYWAGGAFLMAAKRLSEYLFIVGENGEDAPGKYRRSFQFYSTEKLIISCFVYALTSAFGIAIFLIKYRAEFVFTFPIIVLLFGYYLHLGLQTHSAAQKPEHLHRDWVLIAIVTALVVVSVVCTFADFPSIEKILQSRSLTFQ